MFKKSVAIIVLGMMTSSLTACGTDPSLLTTPTVDAQTNQSVEASSYKGIYDEIQKSSKLAFKELDKNGDKIITPDEFGVTSPDQAKAFYALDENLDGKVTEKEFYPGFFGKIGLTLRLKKAADALFKTLDKNKDSLVSKEELTSGLVSKAFIDAFDKYDTQQKTWFHKDAKGELSKSEFENEFASIAESNIKNTPPAPASDPVAPATK
ncbi:MAG: hypothetical protein H7263_17410 [Candidatus Sericytochromatia bacterium]|nr:hypothetical protein [Candidatus Sericytochromatia bacterium]